MNPDLLASLHPPRLPEAFTAPGWDDFLCALGLGLLLAVLVLSIAAPLLQRKPRRLPLSRRVAETAGLPAGERSLALARLLGEGALPADLRAAVYAGQAEPERIEALVLSRRR